MTMMMATSFIVFRRPHLLSKLHVKKRCRLIATFYFWSFVVRWTLTVRPWARARIHPTTTAKTWLERTELDTPSISVPKQYTRKKRRQIYLTSQMVIRSSDRQTCRLQASKKKGCLTILVDPADVFISGSAFVLSDSRSSNTNKSKNKNKQTGRFRRRMRREMMC